MVTKRYTDEWLVEPDVEGAREYARLSVTAEKDGLNIDGQGVIPWQQLLAAKPGLPFGVCERKTTFHR